MRNHPGTPWVRTYPSSFDSTARSTLDPAAPQAPGPERRPERATDWSLLDLLRAVLAALTYGRQR